MKGRNFPNNFLIWSKFTPQPRLAVQYPTYPEGSVAVVYLMGMVFIINLEAKPLLEPTDEFVKALFLSDLPGQGQFMVFPLYGRPASGEFRLEMVLDPAIHEGSENKEDPQMQPDGA